MIYDTVPTQQRYRVRISASRGRVPINPKDRGQSRGRFCQCLELGSGLFTNTLTSVAKDNILWIEREI